MSADAVRVRIAPSPTGDPHVGTAYQALLSGELDIMPLTPALWEEAMQSPAAERLEGFVYYRMSIYQITWNQDGSNDFFVDPRVRLT